MTEPSRNFFHELKRRNVFRVGLAYAVTAWILAQVADLALDNFGAPPWVMKTLLLLLLIGFPLALIFAWAFEKTPEGLKLEKNVDRSQSITSMTGKKMDRGISIALGIAVVFLLADKFMTGPPGDDAGSDRPQQVVAEPAGSTKSVAADSATTVGDEAFPAQDGSLGDKSIAVLPFVNMSSDPEQDYFANGVQEDILTYLSRVAALRVTSRTSVLKYAGDKQEDVGAIARELNVNFILEGSVRKSGNRVRVTAQLIDARSDEHMWAENYDRDMDDVFAIQTEVAQEIVKALQASLSPQEARLLSASPTSSVIAWELYSRAREIMGQTDRSKYAKAETLINEALVEDPQFALAHLQLADIYGMYYWMGDKSEARRESIRLEIDKAIGIAPELPEVQLALGEYYYRVMEDFDGALTVLDKVAFQVPNSADVQVRRGFSLRRLGRWDESIEAFRKAWILDPLSKDTALQLWETMDYARRWEDALAVTEQQMDKGNPDPIVEIQWAWTRLRYLGDLKSAREVLARVPAVNGRYYFLLRITVPFYQRDFESCLRLLDNDPQFIAAAKEPWAAGLFDLLHGQYLLKLDDTERARQHFESALHAIEAHEKLYSDQDGQKYASKALAYAYLGQRQRAVESMSRALELLPESKDRMKGVDVRSSKALMLTVLGDKQQALDELAHQLEVPSGLTEWELFLDPTWDSLRDEPRFQAMVANVAEQAKESGQ